MITFVIIFVNVVSLCFENTYPNNYYKDLFPLYDGTGSNRNPSEKKNSLCGYKYKHAHNDGDDDWAGYGFSTTDSLTEPRTGFP